MAPKQTPRARTALFNPAAAAALSILFTPIFGAQLQALNWTALGEPGLARSSRLWVRMTLWLIGIFMVMQALFRHEPLMRFGGIYFLVVVWLGWMVTTGWRQISFVRSLFGTNYEKRRFGRAIILGAGGWVIYSMVSLSLQLGLALADIDPFRPEPTGVVIRVPEGSDTPVVEPLPPKADGTKH